MMQTNSTRKWRDWMMVILALLGMAGGIYQVFRAVEVENIHLRIEAQAASLSQHEKAQDRTESAVNERLGRIEDKLDRLIEDGRR